MGRRLSVTLAAFLVATSAASLIGQSDQKPLAFEVASVKRDQSLQASESMNLTPAGAFTATHFTLQLLIAVAYGTGGPLPSYRMTGGPSWIDGDRFDILAKMPMPGGTVRDSFAMLRTLLADRFNLVVHHEDRDLPIFVLGMNASDKRFGPKLHASTRECAAGAIPTGSTSDGAPLCALRFGPGRILAGNQTIPALAQTLSRYLLRAVVDRTGLPGRYDMSLEWTPSLGEGLQTSADPNAPHGPADGPPLVTAIKEQLGMRLESTRGPVDVLVIDHVERPLSD
jgi:uncharacterized protein (TIGR03435 family)